MMLLLLNGWMNTGDLKMPIKEKHIVLIAGIPTEDCPDHPDDQVDCIIQKCPKCRCDMWVSKNKRDLRERTPKKLCKFMCWPCALKFIYKEKEISEIEIKVIKFD